MWSVSLKMVMEVTTAKERYMIWIVTVMRSLRVVLFPVFLVDQDSDDCRRMAGSLEDEGNIYCPLMVLFNNLCNLTRLY